MRGLFVVTYDQAWALTPIADWPVVDQVAKLTNPMYAGLWDGKLVCLVGLIPGSMLSSRAYVWLYDTPLAQDHKVAFGRHARRLVGHWRRTYRSIEGHCLSSSSWRWLRSLGATQTSPTTFEIV